MADDDGLKAIADAAATLPKSKETERVSRDPTAPIHTTAEEKVEVARTTEVLSGMNPFAVAAQQKQKQPQQRFKPWVRSDKTRDLRKVDQAIPYPLAKNLGKLRPGHISAYDEGGRVVFVVREEPGTESGVQVSGGEYVIPVDVIGAFLKTPYRSMYEKLLVRCLPTEECERLIQKFCGNGGVAPSSSGNTDNTPAPRVKSRSAVAAERASAAATAAATTTMAPPSVPPASDAPAATGIKRTNSRSGGFPNNATCNVPFGMSLRKIDPRDLHAAIGGLFSAPEFGMFNSGKSLCAYEGRTENEVRDELNSEYRRQKSGNPDALPKIGMPKPAASGGSKIAKKTQGQNVHGSATPSPKRTGT